MKVMYQYIQNEVLPALQRMKLCFYKSLFSSSLVTCVISKHYMLTLHIYCKGSDSLISTSLDLDQARLPENRNVWHFLLTYYLKYADYVVWIIKEFRDHSIIIKTNLYIKCILLNVSQILTFQNDLEVQDSIRINSRNKI